MGILSLFNANNNMQCFICGNNQSDGSKNTCYGKLCKECISILECRGISYRDVSQYTENQIIELRNDTLSPIEKAELFIVENPPIKLNKDEKCYYEGIACGGRVKTITTGYTGQRKGTSIRITKGVTYHTGGSEGRAIREQVLEQSSPGRFFITGNRLILQTNRYGFTIAGDKIDSVTVSQQGICIYSKDKCYYVITGEVSKIFNILNILTEVTESENERKEIEKEAAQQKKIASPSAPHQSGADEIRKYKELLDDGIITKEQFERKRDQILGI